MKISSEIDSAAKIIGEEKTIEYMAKAGYDCWDFSMFRMCNVDWGRGVILDSDHPLYGKNYLAYARKLKKIGLDNGITCNQSHAPFCNHWGLLKDYYKRSLECTAEAGGKICVIHPDNDLSAKENAEGYAELLEFAKGCGVKIATENMWNWDQVKNQPSFAACSTPEDFNAHLDALDDPCFVACLDLGHAEMRPLGTSAAEMIHALGDRLAALHIHDNDLFNDSHQLPFTMKVDFDAIMKALADVDYSGDFTLEAISFLNGYDESNIFDGIKKMAQTARKLADTFEDLK